MAKCLVFSLGVGRRDANGYQKANYCIGGKLYENETIVARSYCDHYGIQRLFGIGTSGSLWSELYLRFGGDDEEKYMDLDEKMRANSVTQADLEAVNAQIDAYTGISGSRCCLIQKGMNDDELVQNLSCYLGISRLIESGDEIYLDITHSFRSLALFSFVMLNYLWEVRGGNFRIAAVLYAMLEECAEYVPVVDLGVIYKLMEWIKAIGAFKNYGNARPMADLVQESGNTTLINSMNAIADSFSLNNLTAIWESMKALQSNTMLIKVLHEQPYTQAVADDIDQFIKRFKTDSMATFQYKLAQWFVESHNYALGYVCLVEAMITKVCLLTQKDPHIYDWREEAKTILLHEDPAEFGMPKSAGSTFNTIYKLRNHIVHQQLPDKRKINAAAQIQTLKTAMQDMEGFLS